MATIVSTNDAQDAVSCVNCSLFRTCAKRQAAEATADKFPLGASILIVEGMRELLARHCEERCTREDVAGITLGDLRGADTEHVLELWAFANGEDAKEGQTAHAAPAQVA